MVQSGIAAILMPGQKLFSFAADGAFGLPPISRNMTDFAAEKRTPEIGPCENE